MIWDHDVDARPDAAGCPERFPVTGVGPHEYVEPVTQPYLRYPHIHGDQVAFVADDDVWLAPVSGGRAWRLTSDHAPATTPRFSPDGTRLAYVSHKDGHPEAYVIELADGATRRLTWLGGTTTTVLGWDDDRVLVASNAGTHERSLTLVRSVGLDGVVEIPRYGPAWGVAEHEGPDGARTTALVSAGYRTPAYWKRYRGGTASVLWLDRGGDDWQRALPGDEAGTYDPIWVGDTLVFTSDRGATFPDHADEQANLWVLDGLATRAETPEPRQLTTQTEAEGYVRDAASDGTRIVWHSRGDLWLLDALDGTPRRLDITLTGALPQPYSADPESARVTIDGLAVDKTGDASVVGWLGTAFWVTHRAGPARALVADPSVRVREPVLLGGTARAAVVTDAPRSEGEGEVQDGSREDAIEIHALPGATGVAPDAAPQRLARGELGRVLHLTASPSGDQVAAISHDGRVSLVATPVDAASDGNAPGTVTLLGRSGNGEAESPTFSPDGRYLAWSSPTGAEGDHHQILVADLHAENPSATPLTSGRFHDFSPAFSDDGKYLVFLSDRTFDPSYDSHEFALSFSAATRPWLIPLAATEPAPFGPSADGWRLSKPDDKDKDGDKHDSGPDEKAAGKDGSKAGENKPDEGRHDGAAASPDIDFDGAEERVVPFPVTSGRYRDLRGAKGGVLWVHETDDAGVLGSRHAGTEEDPAPNVLQFWSFEARKATDVADKVSSYAVSGDGERTVIRSGSSLSTQSATSKPGDDDPSAFEIDLSRVRYEVDPRAQWHQMFDENARIMRDHYWRADMNGVDWDGVVARWRPLVDRIATHDDLVDVLWETVAELNTSHAYVRGPHEPGDTSRRLGLLGADLTRTPDGWRIERVLPSESSDPGASSPLRAAGVDARPGDLIVAVDGRPVDPVAGPSANLVGAAEVPVELTLRRPASTDGQAADGASAAADRRVVVVPLANESDLRYQDWVRSRREYVAEKSDGRLGYVHVPDMMSTGWAQLHRDLRLAAEREGIVVDVRFNGGGHTSQLVIARLAARVAGWGLNRHYDRPASYPDRAPRGPVVLVTNEYAGSDGDIVNAAAQALGVGPVVGVRTWGGVVGIDGRFGLVDGTGITQPRYAFWLDGKGFDVENHGVDPDIEVRHTPADYFSDVDPQLDAGMAEAFRRLAERPAAAPPALPAPLVRRRP